jgi:hypothetical protein
MRLTSLHHHHHRHHQLFIVSFRLAKNPSNKAVKADIAARHRLKDYCHTINMELDLLGGECEK